MVLNNKLCGSLNLYLSIIINEISNLEKEIKNVPNDIYFIKTINQIQYEIIIIIIQNNLFLNENYF